MLRKLHFDALASLVVIFFVKFKPDEVPIFPDTGDGGGVIYNSVHKLV